MLLPLGFGNSPRKFPLAILGILLLILSASVAYFPSIKQADEIGEVQRKKYVKEMTPLIADIAYEACKLKYPASENCSYLQKGQAKQDRSIASEKKSFSVTESLEQIQYMSQFVATPDKWPAEAKGVKGFGELESRHSHLTKLVSNLYADLGFLTSTNINLQSIIVSSFTHNGWLHLIGNVLLLIFIGIWVEQRVGAVNALLLFLIGSAFGLLLQVLIKPYSAILGASAGVTSLMGAFFIFFYRAQFQFLFVGFPIIRRISLPILWAFPFLYFAGDILGMVSGVEDGIAHYAHFGGLALGAGMGFLMVRNDDLGPGELFLEEKALNDHLLTLTEKEELWPSFHKIMRWNCQNKQSLEIFLTRSQDLGVTITDPKEVRLLSRYLSFIGQKIFKNDPDEKVLDWVRLLPAYVPIQNCLTAVPLTQLLSLADASALNNDWNTSLRLYGASLTRKLKEDTRSRIQTAIEALNRMNQEKHSG